MRIEIITDREDRAAQRGGLAGKAELLTASKAPAAVDRPESHLRVQPGAEAILLWQQVHLDDGGDD